MSTMKIAVGRRRRAQADATAAARGSFQLAEREPRRPKTIQRRGGLGVAHGATPGPVRTLARSRGRIRQRLLGRGEPASNGHPCGRQVMSSSAPRSHHGVEGRSPRRWRELDGSRDENQPRVMTSNHPPIDELLPVHTARGPYPTRSRCAPSFDAAQTTLRLSKVGRPRCPRANAGASRVFHAGDWPSAVTRSSRRAARRALAAGLGDPVMAAAPLPAFSIQRPRIQPRPLHLQSVVSDAA